MSRIKETRMKLTPQEIKELLLRFGVTPHDENETEIIFPTVCHNLVGGSPKLYYYKDEKIFKCYTGCNAMFDIFELIIKIHKLRGDEKFHLGNALDFVGIEQDQDYSEETYKDLEYLRNLGSAPKLDFKDENQIQILDKNIIERYPYNSIGVRPWLLEGISEEAMKKFKIGYDQIHNCITIPNFDHSGNLIGIRGRFFNPDAKGKYMPVLYNGKPLSHPTGKVLYGFYENKEAIKNKRVAIIFEGEKSVLKCETFYPNNNVALATTGKKITFEHLDALAPLGITEVVLAYDKDYNTKEEKKKKLEEYENIIELLKQYFQVSIILDENNKLKFKDSPVDQGKDTFEFLMRNRLKR